MGQLNEAAVAALEKYRECMWKLNNKMNEQSGSPGHMARIYREAAVLAENASAYFSEYAGECIRSGSMCDCEGRIKHYRKSFWLVPNRGRMTTYEDSYLNANPMTPCPVCDKLLPEIPSND